MKRILSLILTVAILLTSVVNAVVVLANNNPVITTKINLNDNYQYSFMTTGATSSTTITPDNGKLNVFVYGYERQLSNINSYSVKTWFPRYLLYKDGNALRLTNGNKAIVEVNYKVIGSINQTHGLQIGIGNNSSHSNTEIYVRNSRKHIAGDEGKEFTISSVFTADTQSTVKIAFSGGGNLEITSIVVHELPSTNINDYAVVKYVDGENETTEFVKKNSAPKIPENATDFKGWFTDKEFSGEAVTTITEDVTLYANRSETSSYDIVKTESTTPDNLVGASSNVSISMSGNKISTGSYNGYKLDVSGWGSWRPTFFFLTESGGTKSVFKTKQNSRYIVDMEYVVESPRTDNHSLQVGLFGNIGSNGQTESAIWLDTDAEGNKLFKTHPQADNGKTVNYTVAFTASSAHNLGLIFYGQGSITINSITIKEATDAYAIVKYVDGENETTEFVKKNSAPKIPENATDFKGWFTDKEFSGEAVTTITEDVTLYANRSETSSYDIVKTESTTPDNLVGASSNVSISMSGNKISTGSYNGYKLDVSGWGSWRPTFFFLTESGGTKSVFKTKQNSRYIVDMEYVVESPRTDNHSLQVGLFGNIGSNGQTESAIWLDTDAEGNKLFKTHPQADNGKTVNYTVAFTASSAHNLGLIFYGQGSITINSITIKEATDAYAIVKYVDGENETTEFVKKNGTPKTPENATDFKGWFTNKEFSGEAVTTVTGDITLYAKRETTTPIDPVSPLTTTVIDLNKEFEQYSFMTTGSTSSTTATLKDGKIAVSVSAYERQLANITSYGEKTWFPRLLLYKNDETFNLKTGDKAILEVKYKVIGSVNATHGLQIGLGNNPAASNTEIYVRTSKKHTSLDRGKEFTISSVFTVDANNKMKIAFSGGGQLEITSIVVHELAETAINDYAVVKYIDSYNETTEFAKKESDVKTPSDTSDFEGWFANSDFTGKAVTKITEDITLYAKRKNFVPESPIVTTVVDFNKEFDEHSFITTEKTKNTTATTGNGILDVTVSAYERQLANIKSYSEKTWFPRYLPYAEGEMLRLTAGSRAIVEVKYKITGTPNVNHGIQIGIANGSQGSGTEMYVRNSKKHTADDIGKEFVLTSDFIVDNKPSVKIAFSGGGKLQITSIVIHELPAQYVNDYVAVKFVDGKEQNTEFVKKNAPIKKLAKEFLKFDGWYSDKLFSGSAVTTVDADTTLFAKWSVEDGYGVITFYNDDEKVTKKYKTGTTIDFVPKKDGYNFLGWYKYNNFIGRAVTVATDGLLDLYAKWEEKNPKVELSVDLIKNDNFKTTSKSSESKMTVVGSKLIFDINNYERQLNSTDTSNSDSWFPSYYFVDKDGKNIELEIGTSYELEVAYKIVEVKAGDNIGLQIGFGADGQANQTRTKIKGYAMHTSADNGKEFVYSTSYTAEKFNFGAQHLPKLLFSGQGTLEVISIKIKKILPVIKDTIIGVQTYEDYDIGVETGVLGNKKGTEVSNNANHTSGLFKNKSLKLDLNTEYLRLTGNTVISLMKDGELKPYVAEKGGAYRVTFYMYANQDMNNLHWSINSVDETKKNDYFVYFNMEKDGEVSLKKGKWTEIVAYIPVLKGCESSKSLLAIAVASNGYDGKSVYIDDVKVEQLVDSEVIFYNTLCEEEISPQRAFRGETVLSFKEPKREGYLFDGWYYDSEYKNEAKTYDTFPTELEEIELFAKWTEEPTTAYDFTAGSFDAEIYNKDVTPYENVIADMDAPFDGKNNKGMTQNAVWVKDSGIYGNGTSETDGALAFSNALYSNYTDKSSYNVVRLVNKDGTPYTVVKGERYTINFDYVFASSKGLSYIIPIISEQSAYTGMGKNTTQTIGRVSVMETDTDYLTYKQSFIAEKTGYVYLALTGRDDNANVDTHCYEKVYIDNLEIKRNSNIVKLEIKKGTEVWYTKYGIKGEKLVMPNAIKTGTDTFDGFYLDAEFTKKFDGFYPAEDTTIYIKVKTDKYDKPSDFSKPIVLDFEETELLEVFYRQQKYMTSWSRETENEWIFVTDDEKNALSGKNYIKLNGFSHYWNQAKFALYDPNHAENVMLLDKGGKYRVTVMVRCEDVYESPVNMTICLENPSQQHLLADNGNVKLEYTPAGDKDGYFMFVGDIEVSEEMTYYPSLAIRRNANDLQSIFVDTVMVEKLRDCTVTFEENGGSPVEDAVVQIHDVVVDPGIPYKEGFVFDGWFTDNSFSRIWDFDNDTVEGDMTLYAKWSVEVIKEEKPKEEVKEEPEENTEDIVEIPDFDLDVEEVLDNGEAPTLLEADKVVIENEENNLSLEVDKGISVWVIIAIIAGSVLILGGVAVLTVILIRKKRKI